MKDTDILKDLTVGPWRVVIYENLHTSVVRIGHITWIDFPDPRMALDWIHYDILGYPRRDTMREAGVWLVVKFRTQIRAGQPERAKLNMAKQGIPVGIKQFITEGV